MVCIVRYRFSRKNNFFSTPTTSSDKLAGKVVPGAPIQHLGFRKMPIASPFSFPMAKKFRKTLLNSRFRHSTTTARVEICSGFLVAPRQRPLTSLREQPFLVRFSSTEAVARRNMCHNLAFWWRMKQIKLFPIADFDTTLIARVEICESNAP